METLERPPDRLDVGRIHRPVGVVHVDPEADPPGQVLPVLHVAAHRLPTSLVELGDPEGLDVPLAGGPDLLLDLDLDGEPVAVPPGLAVHEVAGHRPVPRVDVLEGAGEGVADVRPGVRGRRPVVEDPLGAPPRAARRSGRRRRPRPRSAGCAPRARGTAPSRPPAGTGARPSPSVCLPTCETPRPRLARTRRSPRVPPRLPGASRRPAARGRDHGLPLSRADPPAPPASPRLGSDRGSGRMPAGRSAPGSHRPRLALAPRSLRARSRRRLCVHATRGGRARGVRVTLADVASLTGDRCGRRSSRSVR